MYIVVRGVLNIYVSYKKRCAEGEGCGERQAIACQFDNGLQYLGSDITLPIKYKAVLFICALMSIQQKDQIKLGNNKYVRHRQ